MEEGSGRFTLARFTKEVYTRAAKAAFAEIVASAVPSASRGNSIAHAGWYRRQSAARGADDDGACVARLAMGPAWRILWALS